MAIRQLADSNVSSETVDIVVREVEALVEELIVRQIWPDIDLVVCLLYGMDSVNELIPNAEESNVVEFLRGSPVFVYMDPENTYLILNTKEISFKDFFAATHPLKGLLVHELMHIVLRARGLDSGISQLFVQNWKHVVKYLAKLRKIKSLDLSRKQHLNALMINLSTLGLVLKDVYVNDAVISLGFDDELFSHYKDLVQHKLHNLPKMSDKIFSKISKKNLGGGLYKIKPEDIATINVVYRIYLGYIAPWVSFKRAGQHRYLEIKEAVDNEFSVFPETIIRRLDTMCDLMVDAPTPLTSEYTETLINESLRLYYSVLKSAIH